MLKCLLSLLLLSQLIACGGGGGGSGGTSRPSTGVRLLHAGIDLSPLEVVPDGDLSISSGVTKFGDASTYLPVDAGTHAISLRRANTSEIIEQLGIELKKNELSTIIIAGSRAQTNGVHVQANLGSPPELDSGTAAVRIAHGAFGAATVNAMVNSIALVQPIGFTGVSDYQVVPAGSAVVSVTRSVDGASVYAGTFSAQARSAYTVFVAGEIGYYVKTSVITD